MIFLIGTFLEVLSHLSHLSHAPAVFPHPPSRETRYTVPLTNTHRNTQAYQNHNKR